MRKDITVEKITKRGEKMNKSALAKGTRYSPGDGSFTNPYVIEED